MQFVPTTAALLLTLNCASWGADRAPAMRVRLEWGGGAARTWTGQVEIDNGHFERLRPLGVDADLPGTAWVDGPVVRIRRRSGRVYDGLDVTAVGSPDAKLLVTLESSDEPPLRSSFTATLRELATKRRAVAIGSAGDRVSLRRAPGDVLVVDLDRPHLVLDPGETFDCGVSLNVWDRSGRKVRGRLRWSVVAAREGDTNDTSLEGSQLVEFQTTTPDPERIPLRITAPPDEGVYDLRLLLESGGRRHERLVQFVVAASGRPETVESDATLPPDDETDPKVDTEAEREVVDFVDASNGLATRRFHRRGRLAFVRQPVGELARMFAERADDHDTEVEWVAVRMRAKATGTPHRLVVTLDAAVPRTVGISVLQPNAAGSLVPLGLDGGLDITSADTATAEEGVVQYELAFRPRTRQPVVLLHTRSAEIGVQRIELVAVAESSGTEPVPIDLPGEHRLVGPYLHRPLISETFGVGETLDPGTDRSLDDWVTFDTAVREFATHVRRSGGNAAMVTVMTDGGTIFPNPELEPTLRFDTGQHFSTGQDPIAKDVCELLLRRFESESLALLPVLRFSSRIPRLERLARSEPSRGEESAGERPIGGPTDSEPMSRLVPLVDSQGRPLDGDATDAPLLSYDPLDPAVQGVVVEIVREFAERYAAHPALAAVVVDVGTGTCLSYPNDDWGYADEIVLRFARETGAPLPSGVDRAAREKRLALLRGEERERWLAWRSEQVHRLHVLIAETITTVHPRLECVLLTDGERSSDAMSRELPPRTRMLTRVTTRTDQVGRASAPSGQIHFHPPERFRIRDFDDLSPWQPAYTWLATRSLPAGPRGRRPLVVALADDAPMVFEGGWTCQPVVDDATRELRTRIASLPRRRFQLVSKPGQPVVVRTARVENRTWLYAANTLDFPAEVHLRTRAVSPAKLRGLELDGSENLASGHGTTIPINLEPFDFVVLSIDAPVVVEDVEVEFDREAELVLRRRLHRLDGLIAKLRKGTRAHDGGLENPGFEVRTADGAVPQGWSMKVEKASHWRLDDGDARSGRIALKLTPSGRSIASATSEVPLAGASRAIVSAWMKSESDAARVRLVFETGAGGRVRRRYAPVKVTTDWGQHTFRITDFGNGGAEVARVRFEVMGPTPVWIDDVSIDLERISKGRLRTLEKRYAAASLAIDDARYADAARLLDDARLDTDVTSTRTAKSDATDSTTDEGRVESRKPGGWWPFRLLR